MFKKILFGSCLTEYCDHIFNFAFNLAKEAKTILWAPCPVIIVPPALVPGLARG